MTDTVVEIIKDMVRTVVVCLHVATFHHTMCVQAKEKACAKGVLEHTYQIIAVLLGTRISLGRVGV